MRSSRSISDLRPDVAANAKLWLSECRAKGLDVEISNTVRDNEYQAYLYAQGRTRSGSIVTNAKTTTFHGAGLAIDFYSKSKGWSDHSFFLECAAIAKKHGFSWAGDWKSFVEYCHIQWDNHRKSNHLNAPQMPIYKEDEDMKPEEIKKIVDEAVEKALAERDEVVTTSSQGLMTSSVSRTSNGSRKRIYMLWKGSCRSWLAALFCRCIFFLAKGEQ